MKNVLLLLLLSHLVFGHLSVDHIIQKHYVEKEHDHKVQESEDPFEHRCMHDEVVQTLLNHKEAIGEAHDVLNHITPRQATVGPIRFKWVTTSFDSDPRACMTVGQQVQIATNNEPHICTPDDVITEDLKNFIDDQVIPAISEVISSFLSVPSLTNLVLNPPQQCTTDLNFPAGYTTTGVPDTDYVVLATIRPTASSGTVAYAGPCRTLAVSGRPVAGFVNFNPTYFNDLQKANSAFKFAGTVKIGVHEMTHALGFTSGLYSTYRNKQGLVYNPTSTVTLSGTSPAGNAYSVNLPIMKGPAVAKAVQEHYGCESLEGAFLEDFGGQGTAGSHWEQRIAGNEFMTGYINPMMPISALTLALFEDMGWYSVNYGAQQYWGWGKGAGCSFLDRCETSWPSIRGAWCAATNTNDQCNLERTAKGTCTVDTYSNNLEPYYQHFAQANKGGSVAPYDYCPVVVGYSNRYCEDASIGEEGNIYGAGSRCWPTASSAGGLQSGAGATCKRFNCLSENALQIEGSPNQWTDCPVNGGALNVGGVFYDCPPATLFCKGVSGTNHSSIPTPTQVPAPEEEGGKSLCFIATAAYGSGMHPKVWKLRKFRDQVLSQYTLGRWFIQFYYSVSPPIADWISTSDSYRYVTRGLLWPVVKTVETFFD